MYNQKREQVKRINNDLNHEIARKEVALEEQSKERALKRESIRQMALRGKQQIDVYKQSKAQLTRQELKSKTEEEKRLIYKFEKEAQQLEQLEEQLIKRLQVIQDEEKSAFKELEEVMIMASKPKNHRVQPPLQPVNEEEDNADNLATSVQWSILALSN